jgi:hypothetical protein
LGINEAYALASSATTTRSSGHLCPFDLRPHRRADRPDVDVHADFVLGRFGELTFTAKSGHDALVLAGCALGGILLVSTLRADRGRP